MKRFGIVIHDFEVVYLVKIIHFRASYMIFGFVVVFVGPFWCYFLVFGIFFGMRMCDFWGGLFHEIYSFVSSLHGFKFC